MLYKSKTIELLELLDIVRIVDSRDQVLQRKTVRLVLVLWRHLGGE